MKDFLKDLEIGEEKIKLSSDNIKEILKKHGEYIKTETDKVEDKYKADIDNYKSTIDDLKEQIDKAPKSDEIENLKTKIADYEQKESDRLAKEQAKKEDDILTNNVIEAIGDKKFINDYTKNSIVNEIKTALKDSANVGKSAKDLFTEITDGKDGIFANPNKNVDMPGIDENVDNVVSKDEFDKMGYKQRVELKQSNPELFNKYNNS